MKLIVFITLLYSLVHVNAEPLLDTGLIDLSDVTGLLGGLLDTVQNTASGLAQTVTNVVDTLLPQLLGIVGKVLDGIGAIAAPIDAIFANINLIPGVRDLTGSISANIPGIFFSLSNFTAGALQAGAGAVCGGLTTVNNLLTRTSKLLFDLGTGLVSAVANAAKPLLILLFAWGEAMAILVQILVCIARALIVVNSLTNVTDAVCKAVTAVTDLLAGIVGGILSDVSSVLVTLTSLPDRLIVSVSGALKATLFRVGSMIGPLLIGALVAVTNLISAAKGTLDTLNKLLSCIKNAVNLLLNNLGGLLGGIVVGNILDTLGLGPIAAGLLAAATGLLKGVTPVLGI